MSLNAAATTINQKIDFKKLSQECLAALNNIQTLRATFTQQTHSQSGKKPATPPKQRRAKTLADASNAEKPVVRPVTGTLFLKRPGKDDGIFGCMRLLYDQKNMPDILSLGRTIYVMNKEGGTSQEFPLSNTPLALILRRKVSLGRFVVQKDLTVTQNRVFWTLAAGPGSQTNNPALQTHANDTGRLVLIFARQPLRLIGWRIHDIYGGVTTIELNKTEINRPLDPLIFKKSTS